MCIRDRHNSVEKRKKRRTKNIKLYRRAGEKVVSRVTSVDEKRDNGLCIASRSRTTKGDGGGGDVEEKPEITLSAPPLIRCHQRQMTVDFQCNNVCILRFVKKRISFLGEPSSRPYTGVMPDDRR